ncbi:unnamed protein product [Symbiodinium sp. CCMP2592]|nr:unnamed protein product [Symbiodinium sp. CCMP2592]
MSAPMHFSRTPAEEIAGRLLGLTKQCCVQDDRGIGDHCIQVLQVRHSLLHFLLLGQLLLGVHLNLLLRLFHGGCHSLHCSFHLGLVLGLRGLGWDCLLGQPSQEELTGASVEALCLLHQCRHLAVLAIHDE